MKIVEETSQDYVRNDMIKLNILIIQSKFSKISEITVPWYLDNTYSYIEVLQLIFWNYKQPGKLSVYYQYWIFQYFLSVVDKCCATLKNIYHFIGLKNFFTLFIFCLVPPNLVILILLIN